MRLLLASLIPIFLLAGEPTATLTVTEEASQEQPSRPFSISYVFAEGDIRDYAQPVVDGTPETTWQCDPKTRYRDGSASVNVTGASNTEPIYITAADHGFRTGEFATVASVGGNTAADGYWRIYRWGKDKIALIGSSGNGAYTSGGTATGPAAGSLKHTIISFTESLSSDGSFALTFQNSTDPCSSGNQAACDAAGLDAAGMAAFNSGNWNARISVEASSITHDFSDAKTMLAADDFEYWLRGPVVTWVIARDLTTWSYDKGYTCLTNCTTDYSTATWENDTTYKSLTPTYSLIFNTGWSGVRIGYSLENTKTTKMNDQRFALTLESGSALGTDEYGPTTHTMYQKQRWYDVYWDGGEPAAVGIDRNREYFQYTGVVPMYDTSKSVSVGDLATFNTNMAADIFTFGSGAGAWMKSWNAGGGTSRGDPGTLPEWYQMHLMSDFDHESEPYMLKQGYVMGNAVFHRREATTSNYYWDSDADGTANADADDNISGNSAMGRPLSSHTNPTKGNDNPFTEPTTASSSEGWTLDMAHQPQMYGYPYLLSGDPWFLEGMYFMASFNANVPNAHSQHLLGRHGSWSVIPSWGWQIRGLGLGFMSQAVAAYWAPDETMEKELHTDLVINTMAAYEAFTQQRGPLFLKMTNAPDTDPCPASGGDNGGKTYYGLNRASYSPVYLTPWCWGDDAINHRGPNPLGMVANEALMDDGEDVVGCNHMSSWMASWVHHGQIVARDLGFPIEGWLRGGSELFLHMGDDVGWNRALVDSYRMPFYDTGSGNCDNKALWQTWEDFYDAWGATYKADETVNSSTYAYMFKASLTAMVDFADGSSRGWEAYDWYSNETNFVNGMTYDTTAGVHDNGYDFNYKYALIPRVRPTKVHQVEPGDTFFLLRYRAPSTTACTIKVDDNADFGSPVYDSSDGLSSFEREVKATGLTAENPYFWRIACADDPYDSGNSDSNGTLTTLATLSGTASLTVWIGQGQSTTYLDYDQDGAAPWGATDSKSCSSGCTLQGDGLNKGPWFYQVRHVDGNTGVVHQIIVQ